ncbi:telomere-binding alpha subunit central domain-containing protein [Blastomyces gilchristii SLH14081]|uniref:Protection of telomeres protein 1 n=1 Tax=Blastomyces gilchristii (strain SLH14081) TaxID=559298 RepID=A0A179UFL1_BLAGS|nr:telomere-binding alpha subunit central domain-containing protein [Blastomyces gilchristii SLH14081]OAT06533.1 telomere-binding alpha subunit central domain-containing protein [Blastomyces gilchristii SLH14081]
MAPSIPPGFDDIQTAVSRMDRMVNVIAVVVDALPPKLSGGSSYVSTFTLKDHDLDNESWNGLKIRYFNNDESYLPVPQHGDVVLLRQIKVRSYQGAVIGLCSQRDSTPWIIFSKGPNPKAVPQVTMRPGTRDLTATEKSYAFSLIGADYTVATSCQPVQVNQVATSVPLRPLATKPFTKPFTPRRRPKFSLIKDASCGIFVDLVVQVVKTYPEDYQRFLLYVTDYTQNKQLFNYSSEESGPRDGDEYGYTSRPRRDWPGPYGQMTLQVTLWEPHSYYARQNIKENDFVVLQNVNIKIGRMSGVMEGSLHTDRHFPEKIQVIPINDNDSDEDLKKLVKRKLEYWKRMRTENPGHHGNDVNKRKLADDDEQPRNLSKKAKKRLAEQRKKQEAKRKREEDQLEITTSFQAKRDQLNDYIRANNPSVPCRSISDILFNESHTNISPDGIKYRLPFQNLRYKASVRIVDFFPPKLEDFSVQYDVERAMLSDTEGSVSGTDDDNNETGSRKRWEWRFCLLVEDAGPGTHYNRSGPRERMKLYVGNNDAVFLLRLDAVNLRKNPAVLFDLREKLFILWGDLEERKRASMAAAQSSNSSSDNNAGSNDDPNPDPNNQIITASTKPFVCCIKEFGVKRSRASDEGTSDNDDSDECGLGWERRFCMFGTTIV